MIDRSSQFFAILTNVGTAKQANADALGVPWKIASLGVGDAGGADPIPDPAQKQLINERRRAPLNQLRVDETNSAIIIAEQVIPAEVGGWWIREIGLYDEDGDLVAIANCAPSFKPLLDQGSGRTQVLRLNLLVSNASNVELKIDPSVVLATRKYVDDKTKGLAPLDTPAFIGLPTAPDTPRFATGDQIVNVDTLNAVGLQANGRRVINLAREPVTLKATDVGGLISLTGLGGGRLNLPKAKSVPAGAILVIASQTDFVATNVIHVASGDSISGNGDPTESILLRGGDSIMFLSDGKSLWEGVFRNTSDFVGEQFTSQQLLQQGGYQMMPGGLILQWQQLVMPTTAGTSIRFNWPIAFPTVMLACAMASDFINNIAGYHSLAITSRSLTSAQLTCNGSSGDIGANAATTVIGIGY